MGLRVGRAIVGSIEQLFGAERVFIAANVEILEPGGGIGQAVDERLNGHITIGFPTKLIGEVTGVKSGQILASLVHRRGIGSIVGKDSLVAFRKLPESVEHHAVLRHDAELVFHRREIPLHRFGGDRSHRLQLVECLCPQAIDGRAVHQQPGDRQRNQRDCQEGQQKPITKQ